MDLTIVGSGGSQPTPKAGCNCRVCTTARREGGRHVRTGPSLYLHDARLLIDTPEEANFRLAALELAPRFILWTHAHPDHAAGARVVEFLFETRGQPVETYMAHDLYQSMRERYALDYLVGRGFLQITITAPRASFSLGPVQVTPLRHLIPEPVYSYLIEIDGQRLLYAPDHYSSLPVPDGDVQVAVVQTARIPQDYLPEPLPENHPAFKVVKGWRDVIGSWQGRTENLIFTHLYESIRMLPEEYDRLASSAGGPWVKFAHDGMTLTTLKQPASAPAMGLQAYKSRREELNRLYGSQPEKLREELRRLNDEYEKSRNP